MYARDAGADCVWGCDSDAFMVELAAAALLANPPKPAERHPTHVAARNSKLKSSYMKDEDQEQRPMLEILHANSTDLRLDGSTSLGHR